MADFEIKRNDTKPYFVANLTQNGSAYDLSGATSVKFIMKKDGGAQAKVNAVATIVNAVAGTVQYEWIAVDTDTAGSYLAEVEVVDAEGDVLTFPNGAVTPYFTVAITEDLG